MPRHLIVMAILAAVGVAQESRRSAFDASSWKPLFDGSTLDGWVTKGGHYDGDAAWTVEDHAICGREGPNHAGGLLYTAKKYACFILSLDVWMTRPNDSGIFVRMAPDGRGAQVTLDDRENGEVGAVYADEFLAHNTKARRKWQPSTWNRVEVRVTGTDMRVEGWIEGEKVCDHQNLPGTSGFASTGLIGLQVHGDRNDPPGTIVKFRDVRIRELPVFSTADFTCDEAGVMTPTEAGKTRGWRLLTDGKTFDRAIWRDGGFLDDKVASASSRSLWLSPNELTEVLSVEDFTAKPDSRAASAVFRALEGGAGAASRAEAIDWTELAIDDALANPSSFRGRCVRVTGNFFRADPVAGEGTESRPQYDGWTAVRSDRGDAIVAWRSANPVPKTIAPGSMVEIRGVFLQALRYEDKKGVMRTVPFIVAATIRPASAPKTEGGNLATFDDFENFQLQCDFRFDEKGANSGVFLRAARDGSDAAFSGCEIQILDDEGWEKINKAKLKPWQHCGSIYGSLGPRTTGNVDTTGGWNTYRIQYKGSNLRVELNDVVIQETDVTGLEVPEGKKKFAERAKKGFIGLQRHDATMGVSFRNVFVLPLP